MNFLLYSFSTENLEYLTRIAMDGKTVITIGGSLDQAIVSYMRGAKRVINIDNNPHAKHWARMKYHGLQNLEFNDFKKLFLCHSINTLYQKLSHYLTLDTQKFFENLIEEQFNRLYDYRDAKIFNSYYLRNRENYQKAQSSLGEFLWYCQSIEDVANIKEKADIILLSNLSDYAHSMYENPQDFKKKIIEPCVFQLNSQGLIMTGYIYDCYATQRNIVNDPLLRKKFYCDLGNYHEIYVPSALIGSRSSQDCAGILSIL